MTPIAQNAILREGNPQSVLNLIVLIETDASGDDISGTGLWDIRFFLNDESDGGGVRIDLRTEALTAAQASTTVAAGATSSIDGILAFADLRNLTCPAVPYICAELSKGESPNPDFLLTGSLIGCSMINCDGNKLEVSQEDLWCSFICSEHQML